MKKLALIIACLTFLAVTINAMQNLNKATQDLTKALTEVNYEHEKLPVTVVLNKQYDTDVLYNEAKELSRQERREYTVNTLKTFSEATQNDLRKLLLEMEKEGLVSHLRFMWITNIITMDANREALKLLNDHEDVASIALDPMVDLLPSTWEDNVDGRRDDPGRENNSQTRNPTSNLTRIRAPEVWNQGFRGEGVVVAVFDTGVNYNHRDITNRMWQHPDYPYHGYNFVSNNNNPMDQHGHGTHCAGTVAGDGTGGTQTGVAPRSRIMALQVLNSQGSGNASNFISAVQFAIEHGADVLSVSLGWRNASSTNRSNLRSTLVNTLSAGLVAAIAVGNEGRNQNIPENVRTPGNCPPPWLSPDQTERGGVSAVISVGATDNNDRRANFSSVGPVTWQNHAPFNDYPYNPGMGLITPDIMAPGVNVRSLNNSTTGYRNSSGTSMAAPGVAGVLALMLSKDPHMSPEEASRIVEQTAHARPATKSNRMGSGRIDALSAVDAVVGENPPNRAIEPNPGEDAEFVSPTPTLRWMNGGGARSYNVYVGTDNPPTNAINGQNVNNNEIQITEPLESQATYYWRIDAVNENGVTDGIVWSFETSVPKRAEGPEPADNAEHVRITPLLRWFDGGGGKTYKVYLGTDNPPTNFINGLSVEETSYQLVDNLQPETQYYWRVDSENENGRTEGTVWSFTSGLLPGETFNSGDFSANAWEFDYSGTGANPWFICEEESFTGPYSARSGVIDNASSTTLTLTMEIFEDGIISFARKVSSQPNFDFLGFYIDNQFQEQWSGELDWKEVSYNVRRGRRTFRWVYSKSPSGSQGSDAAWIDNITFPGYQVPNPDKEPPQEVSSIVELDHIRLNWGLPATRPIILGYNIYRSLNTADDFERINDEYQTSNIFRDMLTEPGDYHYYVTTIYDQGESEASEIVSININEALSVPSLSPEPSEYNQQIEVKIEADDEESIIYYTLDGSEPTTESLLYEEPITLSESITVSARSYKYGHVPSEIVQGDYIISLSADSYDITPQPIEMVVYPNPIFKGNSLTRSNSHVNIAYNVKEANNAHLQIYNIKGQLVNNLPLNITSGSKGFLSWDLKDSSGNTVGAGLYLLKLKTVDEFTIKRLMIVN